MRSIAILFPAIVISIGGMAQTVPTATAQINSIAHYQFRLSDPQTLPIGISGSLVSAIFGCAGDGAVFTQVATMPGNGSANTDLNLYQVRGPLDVVRFNPNQASGYSRVSPLWRYSAADSEVVALAEGMPLERGAAQGTSKARTIVPLLLTFDRKGSLLSAKQLDANLRPEQVAAFASGDLLLVAWDELRKQTTLTVLNPNGDTKRAINLMEKDPVDAGNALQSLVTLHLYPYGKNLLLIPQDTRLPILEVNEYGVVNTYTLHIPRAYERGLPVSLTPRSWKFRMLPKHTVESTAPGSSAAPIGLAALQATQGPILEFDPGDGRVTRQFDLPASGFQPACENNGEFIFMSSHSGDGKLQMATGVAVD